MRAFLSILLTSCCIALSANGEDRDYASLVNPLVGTMSAFELSNGNTYPAIAVPWGMNFWTPQTGRMGNGWVYSYQFNKINGFRQTHQPSPWMNDFGCFSIMPVTGKAGIREQERASWFSHKSEKALPYYYSVYLADHDTFVEIAPTSRSAVFRITYPRNGAARLVIDAFDGGSSIRFDKKANAVTGYTVKNSGGIEGTFRNWFVVRFPVPVDVQVTELKKGHAVASVTLSLPEKRTVEVQVASSFISEEQAWTNLRESEAGFDAVEKAAHEQWNEMLGRIEIEGGSYSQKRTFYSCLYRALLFPQTLHEISADGTVVHFSPYNGKVEKGCLYGGTGFWDTFRALFPLLNLVYPDINGKMQEGWLNAWRESGFFPEWSSPGHRKCMIGNNSASVVSEAILLGVTDKKIRRQMYDAMLSGAGSFLEGSSSGREGYELYDKLGYVPCDVDIKESAARTLEYAYDDWCIYRVACALGRPAKEKALLRARAMNYRNLFDPSVSLMRGRKADGSWAPDFNPLKWGGDFTEGNSLHYTWSVFHDIAGLVELMGGQEAFERKLDYVIDCPPDFDESYYHQVIHEIREMQIMNMGNYAHGNQPIQHMLYLYNYAGKPWKTQKWVRAVMDRFYSDAPDGYCGDEDNGQTSAWYVFSAMGFYPVCPGSGQYVTGAPLFKKVSVHLPSGKTFSVTAGVDPSDSPYVSSVTVDGKPWSKLYLRHEDLSSGASVVFNMVPDPATAFVPAAGDLPYSLSTTEKP